MKCFALLIFKGLVLINCLPLFSQTERIVEFYDAVEKAAGEEGFQLTFVQPEMNLVDDYENLQQIILIRHGEPALKKHGWLKRKEAQAFVRAYDSVGIYTPEKKPVLLYSNELDTIFTSSIPRAKNTAELIFGADIAFQPYPLFREFERKIFAFPNLRLPLKYWLVKSRILWFFGTNKKGIESFSKAKKRAKQGVELLEQKAARDGKVVLVSHGLLNRFLVKYLKKNGWQVARDGGSGYLASWLLVRVGE